ncbi:MAG: hypothetical protein SOR57_11340 [Parabacteroides sp.]|nr:hypothetical protein [Parabacteroides sp.]
MRIYFLTFILLLQACNQSFDIRSDLRKAEKLLYADPKSSYQLLDSISSTETTLSEKENAFYCMLMAHLSDSIHTDLPSAYRLEKAVSYYKKNGSTQDFARMSYYQGRSYYNERKYDKALAIYMDALNLAVELEDWNLAGYINCYMADVYNAILSYPLAKKGYMQGVVCFQKAKNQRNQALAYRDIGRICAYSDSLDLALDYMYMADSLVKEAGDSADRASVLNGLGNIYALKGDFSSAEKYLWKAVHFDNIDNAPTYKALAHFYLQHNKLEEAESCIEKAYKPTANKYTHLELSYTNAVLAEKKGDLNSALFYMKKYISDADSIRRLQNDNKILEIEKKYNNTLYLLENIELKNHRLYLYLLCGLLLILIMSLILIYQYFLRKRNLRIHQQEIKIHKQTKDLSDLLNAFKIKQLELSNITIQLDEYKKKQGLYDDYLCLMEQFQKLSKENVVLLQSIKENRFLLIESSSIKRNLLELSSTKRLFKKKTSLITPGLWKKIFSFIDSVFPSIKLMIEEKQIEGRLRQYCYLSVFCLDTNQEAILLDIQPESVSKLRFRVKQVLNITKQNITLYEYWDGLC